MRHDAAISSRGPVTEAWCATKHCLHAEGHIEEMIANASRAGDRSEVFALAKDLDDVRAIRQRIMKRAAGKEVALQKSALSGCDRCASDMVERGVSGPSCPRCRRGLTVKPTFGGLGDVGLCPACMLAFAL